MPKLVVPLILLPFLAGCAVVDLAAHGVKQYEKSKQPADQQSVASEAPPPVQAQPMRNDEPEQPLMAPTAPSGAIRAQSLD